MLNKLINKHEFSGNKSSASPIRDRANRCQPMTWDQQSFNLARTYDMNNSTPNSPLRNSDQPDPVDFFTLRPNIDTLSLLAHACETAASLNVMSADLARDLESSHRNVALAIQQLAVLAELLVNRALDNLDPPYGIQRHPVAPVE